MRKLLMTTAVAVAMATPMAAQDAADTFTAESAAGDFYGSELIGKRLYVSESEVDADREWTEEARAEWDDVGEIGDILVGENGEVKAVLLDIGGFLGIGEKRIAVNMDELQFLSEGDNAADYFVVIQGDPAMLESAPEFTMEEAGMAAGETMTDTSMAEEDMAADDDVTGESTSDEEMASETPMPDESASGDEVAEGEFTTEQSVAEEEMANEETAPQAPMPETPGNTTMWTAPELNENYEDVAQTDLTAEMLEGTIVYGPEQENLGEISDLVLAEDGAVRQAIVDVGGFLGIGEHRIAVEFEELRVVRDPEYGTVEVHVGATREQLEERPEYEG